MSETTEAAVKIVLARYTDVQVARAAIGKVGEAVKNNSVTLKNMAVLMKGPRGGVNIMDASDVTGGQGLVTGGIVAAVVGIFTGGILTAAALGALLGGLYAKLRDTGFKDSDLKDIVAELSPGDVLLVAAVPVDMVDDAQQVLMASGATATFVTDSIDAAVAADLDAEFDTKKDDVDLTTPISTDSAA
jgi:uncharacterized membrane protein